MDRGSRFIERVAPGLRPSSVRRRFRSLGLAPPCATPNDRRASMVLCRSSVVTLLSMLGLLVVPARAGATSSSGGAINLVQSLFPTTSAEWSSISGNSLRIFVKKAQVKALSDCLSAKGLREDLYNSLVGSIPSQIADNLQFPDLQALKSGSFGVIASTWKFTSPYSGDFHVYNTNLSYCDNKSEQQLETTMKLLNGPTSAWTQVVTRIYESREVAGAWTSWSACMSRLGVTQSSSVQTFFGFANSLELGGTPERATLAHLAVTYGTCVAPVAKVLDALRLSAWRKFTVTQPDLESSLMAFRAALLTLNSRLGVQHGLVVATGL
jgi:hypothetical protein